MCYSACLRHLFTYNITYSPTDLFSLPINKKSLTEICQGRINIRGATLIDANAPTFHVLSNADVFYGVPAPTHILAKIRFLIALKSPFCFNFFIAITPPATLFQKAYETYYSSSTVSFIIFF